MFATTCDPEADAMFIRFSDDAVKSVRTEEVSPGIMLAADGRMIAIAVLDVRDRLTARAVAA